MTDKRITDLQQLMDPVSADALVCVDVSDTTMSPEGTTKKVTVQSLFNQNQFFGWANYSDSQYTQSSPRAISSGVRTQITINGLGATTNKVHMNEAVDLWSNNAIRPISSGDAYDVRLSFKATVAGVDKNITLDLDIGTGTPVKIYEENRRFLKSSGAENSFVFAIPIFALDDFLANGGRFFVTANDSATIYDARILIVKTYRNIS